MTRAFDHEIVFQLKPDSLQKRLRIGLIVNPIAGMGGFVGLKGTDGPETVAEARRIGARPTACERTKRALMVLSSRNADCDFVAPAGEMGGCILRELGIEHEAFPLADEPSARATQSAADECRRRNADVIVFGGGDGTARDLAQVVGLNTPLMGIPCGVKMHSGVFAVTPEAAGSLLADIARPDAGIPEFREAEIMDADEASIQEGRLSARLFGYAMAPIQRLRIQSPKSSPRISDEAMLDALGEEVASEFQRGVLYLIGPGTTAKTTMKALGLESALLGVDAVRDGRLVAADMSGPEGLELLKAGPAHIVGGVTGGQGFIFGRGNQQISPNAIRRCWPDKTTILASAEKLMRLPSGALLADTGDPNLDAELQGYKAVRTGPRRSMMMRIA